MRCVAVRTASPDTSTLTTATQSFSSLIDTPATTTAFIAQARHRGDGQDVDNTTSSSDTRSVPAAAALSLHFTSLFYLLYLQWFDAVGWAPGRASSL